jgi:hypothetical protein
MRILILLTIAGIAACGNTNGGDAGAPAPAREDAGVPADTIPAAAAPAAEVPELPPDFPSDFPLPPDHVVMEGAATRDEAGVFASALLGVQAADPAEPLAWYRQALGDAGWQVAAQGRSDAGHTLHATLGESYVDLTVRPDAGRPGWVVIEASIWKVEAL